MNTATLNAKHRVIGSDCQDTSTETDVNANVTRRPLRVFSNELQDMVTTCGQKRADEHTPPNTCEHKHTTTHALPQNAFHHEHHKTQHELHMHTNASTTQRSVVCVCVLVCVAMVVKEKSVKQELDVAHSQTHLFTIQTQFTSPRTSRVCTEKGFQ